MQIVPSHPSIDRAEFALLRQPGKRILLGDLGQRQRALDQLANSVRGQVAGGGRSRPKPQKCPQPQAPRPRLLQRLHLAHAHIHTEFVALAGHGFSIAGAGFDGELDHIGGQGFEVLRVRFRFGHVYLWVMQVC